MNIIISSLDNIRKTGSNNNIDSSKLFIAKRIRSHDTVDIRLKAPNGETYNLIKTLETEWEKIEFLGYKLASLVNIPAGIYTIEVYCENIVTASLSGVKIVEIDALVDEHEPAYVLGRKITGVKNIIVAQDAYSQQMSFYMRKKYDGISLFDETKQIKFDFIPVDKQDLYKEEFKLADGTYPAFLSDKAFAIVDNVAPAGQEPNEWMLVKWNPSYLATKTAGNVKFAISVVAASGDERVYTWQTEPSILKVVPNLGFRAGTVFSPEEESTLETLVTEVSNLKQEINAIDDFLGNQTDGDPSNDQELIVGGGGAAEFIGG